MTTLHVPMGGVAAARSSSAARASSGPSERERISHVVRRLGIGSYPSLAATAIDLGEAITRSLDLSVDPAPLPPFDPPADFQAANTPRDIQIPLTHWFEQMVLSPRRIEERLVWFWHDHFATSLRKVRLPFLFWQQHATVRAHATGRFDDLLRAIARDPAMLVYLDGRSNEARAINENFAREVMELHTMGRGAYTQDDVVAAARAFTGWVMNPGREDRRHVPRFEPWSSFFVPFRHDDGEKTLLGLTGRLDMDDAIGVILEQPETAVRVASKLYDELVGLPIDESTARHLGDVFRAEWQIMPLVEEIVSDPVFTSDAAVRSRVRTPVEKVVGIYQGIETGDDGGRFAIRALDAIGFVPFYPPNPAGFPKGERLLGPYQLAHSLDLAAVVTRSAPDHPTEEIFARLGIWDVCDASRAVVDAAPDPAARIALAIASPEYALI